MKSTCEQLISRGFVPEEEIEKNKNITDLEIKVLLNSSNPCDRTIGAVISSVRKDKNNLPLLCSLLEKEKMLYSKIAISEAIEACGIYALEYIVPLLGKIGCNQHKQPVIADLNKKTYPLPRDIAARIIAGIGDIALPYLEEILLSGDYIQTLEAIDAIGHITYNFNNFRSENHLFQFYEAHIDDEIITWKIIRALQSFRSKTAENFLKQIIADNYNSIFTAEAERSLKQIAKRGGAF